MFFEKIVETVPAVITLKILCVFALVGLSSLINKARVLRKHSAGTTQVSQAHGYTQIPVPASGELIRADILSNVWEKHIGRHTCWEGGVSADCPETGGEQSLCAVGGGRGVNK